MREERGERYPKERERKKEKRKLKLIEIREEREINKKNCMSYSTL